MNGMMQRTTATIFSCGALALQVLADGPNIPDYSATVQPMGELKAVAATTATIEVPVVNMGGQTVNSLSYVASVDGETRQEAVCELESGVDEMGLLFHIDVSLDVPPAAREHTLNVEVTKVNGQKLTERSKTTTTLIALSREAVKRTVMEEFTGTWCLNCVRGMAGIELLEQLYGDRFIAIAMHSDDTANPRDPMVVPAYRNSTFYRNKQQVLGGLPSCTIDRWIDCDPYCGLLTTGTFQTDGLVAEALARPAVADLRLTATWTDERMTDIAYQVETDFLYSSDDAHYSLILVLTADSLTGDDPRWRQRNGYNDYTGTDEALLQFAGRGAYLTDIAYNHVAADIAGVNDGIPGSIASPLAEGTTQLFTYTLNVADNTIIQDRQQLNAIAMLIDTRDGAVVNAAKAHVASATGIGEKKMSTDKSNGSNDGLYDLLGRRVGSGNAMNGKLHPGLYTIHGRLFLKAR